MAVPYPNKPVNFSFDSVLLFENGCLNPLLENKIRFDDDH